ncbi:MAG TPA: beta-propeller fold lactonase family protein, partial [Verrucomicrobiae bacterium]|nr:beta-propeller fold lactonase family protein [Verrucomicrobiae bacterium]
MHWSGFVPCVRAFAVTLGVVVAGCVSHTPLTDQTPQTAGLVAPDHQQTPTGQLLTPAGRQIELPGMRPQALALSPDGSVLATAGKNRTLVLVDPATGQVLQTLPLSTTRGKAAPESDEGGTATVKPEDADKAITAQMSFTGLVFSPDGRWLFLSNTGGDIWRFPVLPSHQLGQPTVLPLPQANVPDTKTELPVGLAVSADGQRLYVAGSLGNQLYELNAASGKLLRSWNTGAAPFDVALTGGKAYVSNLGGRRPGAGDVTAPAGRGTTVRVDPTRHIANEGSVTIIDLAAESSGPQPKDEIMVGLHPSALAVSPNGKYVVVANSGSDTLSVIDARTDKVVEKIWVRQSPGDLFGAQPCALTFDPSGRRLYVCNGTQNAVAVIEFEPQRNASEMLGLIPVGWFPGAIQYDARRRTLCVANMRGVGAGKVFAPGEPVKLHTKDFVGSLSLVPLPAKRALAGYTRTALHNMRYPKLQEALLPPRPNQPPRPVPERVGEPSVFKHVIYVIKENRTYDQVLGDMPEGNGDASLCIFGERITPNQHKLSREFVLLDNTYCASVQSADGHQWTDSAIANEYMERQISSDTPRSYPGGKSESGVDALAWASSGFIWDNALAHGRSFRNYGEWMISEAGWTDPKRKGHPTWLDFWREHQSGEGRV